MAENWYLSIKKIGFIPIFFLLLMLTQHKLIAQIGIGEWRDHLSYSHARKLSIAGDNIFVTTPEAMFVYNRKNHETEKLSKITVLSDFEIADIVYSSQYQMHVLAYANGNLDFIYNNGNVLNIPDIYNKIELGSVHINQLFLSGNLAYLAASYGISVVDISRKEIKESYYIGNNGTQEEVQNLHMAGDSIFALMADNIKKAAANNRFLSDVNQWKNLDFPTGTKNALFLCGTDKEIYLCTQSDTAYHVYSYTSKWNLQLSFEEKPKNFYQHNNQIYLLLEQKAQIYSNSFYLIKEFNNYGFGDFNPNEIIADATNFYFADEYLGLVLYENQQFKSVYPNGPLYSDAFTIKSKGDYLYAAPGAVDLAWNNSFQTVGLHRFWNETWNSNFLWTEKGRDLINIAIDPYNPAHVFGSTWSDGIYEFQDFQLKKIYNQENSPLENISPYTEGFVRVGGMAFDAANQLWVNNSGVPNALHVLKSNGEWTSFPVGNAINAPTMGEIIIDDYNQKWIVLPRGYGLLVYNDNFTTDIPSDDYYKQIDVKDETGELITNQIYCIAKDLDGTIWLGTDKGVVSYFNPAGFKENQNFYASRLKVFEEENDSVVQYLLETQTVTSIAVDGANRKWIGTAGGGVFLVTADGQQTIVSFNTSNSPLISNQIRDIEINDNTGEVFFATDKGKVSYKGTATTGHEDYFDVYVYPNPVLPSYNGVITITGLVSNVNVKITDMAGNLVFETKALGGQAQWTGTNLSGRRVASGVYLVFSSNADGTKTYVTKILFFN